MITFFLPFELFVLGGDPAVAGFSVFFQLMVMRFLPAFGRVCPLPFRVDGDGKPGSGMLRYSLAGSGGNGDLSFSGVLIVTFPVLETVAILGC